MSQLPPRTHTVGPVQTVQEKVWTSSAMGNNDQRGFRNGRGAMNAQFSQPAKQVRFRGQYTGGTSSLQPPRRERFNAQFAHNASPQGIYKMPFVDNASAHYASRPMPFNQEARANAPSRYTPHSGGFESPPHGNDTRYKIRYQPISNAGSSQSRLAMHHGQDRFDNEAYNPSTHRVGTTHRIHNPGFVHPDQHQAYEYYDDTRPVGVYEDEDDQDRSPESYAHHDARNYNFNQQGYNKENIPPNGFEAIGGRKRAVYDQNHNNYSYKCLTMEGGCGGVGHTSSFCWLNPASTVNRLDEFAFRAFSFGIQPKPAIRPYPQVPLYSRPTAGNVIEFALIPQEMTERLNEPGSSTLCKLTRKGPAAFIVEQAAMPAAHVNQCSGPGPAQQRPPDHAEQEAQAQDPGAHTPEHVGNWAVILQDQPPQRKWTGRLVDSLLGSRMAQRKTMVETISRFYAPNSIPVAIIEAIDSSHRSGEIAAVLNGARFAMANVRDVVACM